MAVCGRHQSQEKSTLAMKPDEARSPVPLAARQRGNRAGFWCFRAFVRVFGRGGAYGLLYFVCLHYLLFDRAAVTGAKAYLRRRFPAHGRARLALDVYRLFLFQGKTLIDRFCLISGQGGLRVATAGFEKIADLRDSGAGFVLLTAHVGNWQAVMNALHNLDRTVHLVMRPEDNRAVQEALRISQAEERVKVISPDRFLDEVAGIIRVIGQGDIVSIMGDRSYGYSALPVEFLGAPARFPYGAFSIAAAAGCPVVVLLSAKVSAAEYVVEVAGVIRPEYRAGRPKKEQVGEWLREFAGMLETYVAAHPYQCFLFHDVWADAGD